MKEALNDINKEQNNIIQAMELRGYQQIDIEGNKISFRRIDNEQNRGDTRDWTFQYNNWSEVKEALKYVPLWEPAEITKKVKALIDSIEDELNEKKEENDNFNIEKEMLLEERYTKAMELAGYVRLEDPIDDMVTLAFGNPDNENDIIRTDGWEALGDVLESMESVSASDKEKFKKLIHPEGRIIFYTQNLGGTGAGEDVHSVIYSNLRDALDAYLNANVDGKKLGYRINEEEIVLTYFSTVDMKNHVNDFYNPKLYSKLAVNEKKEIRDAISYMKPILDKDNVYNAIQEGFITIGEKSIATMLKSKMEWGPWFGRVANLHRPQDYIDIDIEGLSSWHKVIYSINVVHANEIVDGKQYFINVDTENFEESIRQGFREAVDNLETFFHEAVDKLNTDIEYPMLLYSPYTFRELQEHYTKLENAGYEMFPFKQKGLDEMSQEEMKNYIQSFYRGIDEKIICTSRISEALATTICQMIKKKQLSSDPKAVEELLMKDNTLKFIREREPYVEPVPEQVIKSVRGYFEHKFSQMTPIEIFRMSNHKEDDYLYGVIAVQGNGKYACWTSWNQHSENMNFGHYDLSTKEIAFSIIDENFNDISDEKEMFGPLKSRTIIENDVQEERYKDKMQTEEQVINPFRNRNKGR